MSTSQINAKNVLQFADTDVGLGSLAAPAWRFLHCGSGTSLPRFVATVPLRSTSLTAINTLIRTYPAGAYAGIWVYVTTAGAVTVTWYDAADGVLQTAASANGVITINNTFAITIWSDGTNFGALVNGADAIASTALAFAPVETHASNLQVGNGTAQVIVGQVGAPSIVAGYGSAASTLAHHNESRAMYGV
jgi:hypothetical protein